jgi:hypothetical protein
MHEPFFRCLESIIDNGFDITSHDEPVGQLRLSAHNGLCPGMTMAPGEHLLVRSSVSLVLACQDEETLQSC